MSATTRDEPEPTEDVGTAAAGEKTGVDAAAAAAKRAKSEKIGRYVAMFVMPLLMVGMMVWGYMGALHSPTPHHMPVTVTTQSTSQQAQATAEALSQGLSDVGDEAFSVKTVPGADEARQQVIDRDASGAVVVGDNGVTLYTASGAGAQQASTVQQMVGAVAAAGHSSSTAGSRTWARRFSTRSVRGWRSSVTVPSASVRRVRSSV